MKRVLERTAVLHAFRRGDRVKACGRAGRVGAVHVTVSYSVAFDGDGQSQEVQEREMELLTARENGQTWLMNTLQTVARRRGLPVNEIIGPRQFACLVDARREFAGLAREAGASLPQIGSMLNRHHTSVLNLLDPKSQSKQAVPA